MCTDTENLNLLAQNPNLCPQNPKMCAQNVCALISDLWPQNYNLKYDKIKILF